MISQNCSGHIYGNYRYDCKAILIETKHGMLRVVNSVEQKSAVVNQLQSPQEEADRPTRILLHAKHHASDNEYNLSWLYLRTVMFMYFALHWQRTSIVTFYQIRGTKTRMRYLVQKLFH